MLRVGQALFDECAKGLDNCISRLLQSLDDFVFLDDDISLSIESRKRIAHWPWQILRLVRWGVLRSGGTRQPNRVQSGWQQRRMCDQAKGQGAQHGQLYTWRQPAASEKGHTLVAVRQACRSPKPLNTLGEMQ